MVSNARTFALSYLDDPPLHLWIVGGMAKLVGSEDPLLLRLPFIALFAGSTWLTYRLTAGLFGARAGLWAAALLNLAPVFTIAHATWVLPDGPLIFFMLAAATIAAGILFGEWPCPHPTLAWIAAGLCGGLACLSKFHGAFVFFAIFAFLLSVPRQRRWLATPGPWLGVLAAALVFAPVIIWNFQHGFANFSFQAGRLSGRNGLTLRYLAESIGGQFAYLTPWLIVPLGYYVGRALWGGPSMPRRWFLGLLAIGPIVVFTGTALFALSLPHWPMPGWIFAFPLMGEAAAITAQRRPRLAYGYLIFSAAVLAAIIGAAELQIATGALTRALPASSASRDPTLDLVPWSPLGPALAERGLIDANTPAVAAVNWIETGKVNLAVGEMVPVFCFCEGLLQLPFQHHPQDFVGKNVIVVGTRHSLSDAGRLAAVASHFAKLEPLAPVTLMRGGQPALELMLYRGVDLKD
jgi:4-amino-4-deoxy-L-arabinose transferase-like glycosyltransferase